MINPITFFVENKDGNNVFSEHFDVNMIVSFFRIEAVDKPTIHDCMNLWFNIDNLFVNCMSSDNNSLKKVTDIPYETFIKSTKQLSFPLRKNTKVKVSLFLKDDIKKQFKNGYSK